MRVIDLRGRELSADLLPRPEVDVEAATAIVRDIVDDVARRGEVAVLDAGERLDGVRPASLRVPASAMADALAGLDPDVRAALETAIERVRTVHTAQQRTETTIEVSPGGFVTQRWLPVDRVGLYVPGGRAVYPSSVVMNVVPAQLAGVVSIAVSSPPQPEFGGLPHPSILAACELLGVEEVYAAGGAQAVALFAHGADLSAGGRCEPVSMVTGPGNIWVTAAKRLLKGRIGIDSEAGPTEILIIADDSAVPSFVAADLISQAEHDVVAASVLVTDSTELVTAVLAELEVAVAATKHSGRIRQALAGVQSGIALVDDLASAVELANMYAAEHLEIQTAEAAEVAGRIRNAGAVFVGDFSPVSLGDYAAGSNHVLPTGGCACHSAGLSVQTFLRGVQVIDYSRAALTEIAPTVLALSAAEDLPAHGAAVAVRLLDR
ncbi:MAG: histidinol dehydrogenase [Actinomycetota bacterium]|nr:histidinol dehydrogenase [Actinomycetota bacterium]